jgi:hypothetical protein
MLLLQGSNNGTDFHPGGAITNGGQELISRDALHGSKRYNYCSIMSATTISSTPTKLPGAYTCKE